MEGPADWAGGPPRPPCKGEVANHPELLRSRAVVVSVVGKVAPMSAAGMGQEGERKRSTDDVSKGKQDDIETGENREPGMSLRSEEHTSELQSRQYLVCRLLLEKKKKK